MKLDDATARVLSGTKVATEIREGLRPRVETFCRAAGRAPMLGLLLVGADPGSQIYVRNKIKASEGLGMATDLRRLPETASFDDVLDIVRSFNASAAHDGILVQSPLPVGLGAEAEQKIFDAIDPDKDVDGFHPVNVGRLVQKRPALTPCTPLGIIELLDRAQIEISGKRAVVIGRSDIVGKPIAMLLLHRNATVTVCHSKTVALARVASTADILVVAVGVPAFVTRAFVKPGATVIDVGTNPLTDRDRVEMIFGEGTMKMAAFEKRGTVLSGDVHPEVGSVAGALTPVPGGVGPLTIAMLLSNTVRAAEDRLNSDRRT